MRRSPVGLLWRVRMLRVSGPSMVPTLRHDDIVVLVSGRPVRPGSVVVGRFRSRPDLLVVKRAVEPSGDGWRLGSDNPAAGGDSSVHGVADVDGGVVLRLRRRSWPRIVRRFAAEPPRPGSARP